MDPYRLPVQRYVAFNERKVNVKRFWIAGQRSFKIGRSYCRQNRPPVTTSPFDSDVSK